MVILPAVIPVTMCAPVVATQDGLVEGNHDFSINIASSFATVVMPDTTSVTIMDDDGMLQGIVIHVAYTVAVMNVTNVVLSATWNVVFSILNTELDSLCT